MINKNLLEKLNISYLYPYQTLVVNNLIINSKTKNKDQIIVLPTGYGKTLCFTLSSLHLNNKTLILYPLRSLLFDQKDRISNIGKTICFHGGQTQTQRQELFKALDDAKFILVSIESVLNLEIFNNLNKFYYDLIVFDEAHTLYYWGLSFRPKMMECILKVHLLSHSIITLFTATCDESTLEFFKTVVLLNSDFDSIFANIDRKNIKYYLIPTFSKFFFLSNTLSNSSYLPSIIFFNKRLDCEKVAMQLKYFFDFEVYFYHSKLTSEEKKDIEDKFKNSSKAILCSTNAYGMGVDKKNIRSIIHYDIFGNSSSFLQETGRAARDNKNGYSFILKDSFTINSKLSKIINNKTCIRESVLKEMNIDLDYCNGCSFCDNSFYTVNTLVKKIIYQILFHPLYYTSEKLLKNFVSKSYLNFLQKNPTRSKYISNSLVIKQIISNLINLDIIKIKKHFPFKRYLYISFDFKKKLNKFIN